MSIGCGEPAGIAAPNLSVTPLRNNESKIAIEKITWNLGDVWDIKIHSNESLVTFGAIIRKKLTIMFFISVIRK